MYEIQTMTQEEQKAFLRRVILHDPRQHHVESSGKAGTVEPDHIQSNWHGAVEDDYSEESMP